MIALQANYFSVTSPFFHMGKKPQISATLPAHVNDAISHRADLLGDSKSNYLSAIASWWFGQGCPPVRADEEQLAALKKRLKPLPKNLDAWHLDKNEAYSITGDDVVQKLLNQLGIPNLFAAAQEHDKVRAFVPFDNHPTHWLVFHLFKGTKDDGLLFEAHPKSSTTREEMLTNLSSAETDMEPGQELVFSQLPVLPAKTSPAHPTKQAPSR